MSCVLCDDPWDDPWVECYPMDRPTGRPVGRRMFRMPPHQGGMVRIFVVQKQSNIIFGLYTVLKGGFLGYETVSTGSFESCAVL